MLEIQVPPLPEGTPPPHHGNGISSQGDLFLYKARECKSAPANRSIIKMDKSGSSSDSESSSSSSSSSVPSATNTSTKTPSSKSKKSSRREKSCFCVCCPSTNFFSCSSLSGYFFGHAPKFTTWTTSFASTSRLKYLSLFFFESSLRAVADVQFCSNPWSGLIIFIAMLIASPMVAFLSFVTLTFGIETAVVFLHIPMEDIRSGAVGFNNFLTGTVIALIAQPDVILAYPDIIAMCMVVGVLTVVIWKGLNGILAERLEFPLLNAPFHVMMLLYIFSGIASRYAPIAPVIHADTMEVQGTTLEDLTSSLNSSQATTPMPFPPGVSLTYVEPLDWRKVFFGVLLAPSQVFGTNTLATSVMVHLAMLLYSPIMLMQSLMGSAIGTLIGICLTNPEDYGYLYNGSWGYNPLFTSAALGGFFVVFNIHSWLLSVIGAVLTTLLYSAMNKCHVPPLGMPFMLTTWLLLPSITSFNKVADSQQPETNTIDIQQPYLTHNENEQEDENKQRPKIDSVPSTPAFIRLRLGQITTPEEHRKNFLPKRPNRPQRKKSRKRSQDSESLGNGGGKNGVKYRTSIAVSSPQQPPQPLMLGGHNSILPL